MEIRVIMHLAKETKGALQYREDSSGNKREIREDYKIGTLYLRKSAIGKGFPKTITVHIEEL